MINKQDFNIALIGGEEEWSLSASERSQLSLLLLSEGFATHMMNEEIEINQQSKDKWLFIFKAIDIEKQDSLSQSQNLNTFFYHSDINPDDFLGEVNQYVNKGPEKTWKPWFPVIDYDRCTNCMQCLSFCLFDVYSVKNETITVQNEDKCKTDCPACSRVCPEAAILFPKYKHAPINGAPVNEDGVQNEKMKVDISTLLGGDIYSSLKSRTRNANTRFSKERSEDKALKERRKCLIDLKNKLDIPDSVLESLPSDKMIQEKLNEQ